MLTRGAGAPSQRRPSTRAGAWRVGDREPRYRQGRELRGHPAWHDLDPSGRELVYTTTRAMRELEAALDPEGLSSTARAVLARIRSRR
jgi:hypothetical protein